MNMVAPEKREAAVELLKSGASIRATAKALGVHKNTIASINETIRPRTPVSPSAICSSRSKNITGPDGLNKFQRYYAKRKSMGGFSTETCADCGQPRHNGGAARCRNCWRRTAALKRLAKQHHEDSPEYEAGVMEIFATDYTKQTPAEIRK